MYILAYCWCLGLTQFSQAAKNIERLHEPFHGFTLEGHGKTEPPVNELHSYAREEAAQ